MSLTIKKLGQVQFSRPIYTPEQQSILNFIDPTWIGHRRPLPMVAHINGRITPQSFSLVAEEGAIPVYHVGDTSSVGARRAKAKAAALAAIEGMRFDWEVAKLRMEEKNGATYTWFDPIEVA